MEQSRNSRNSGDRNLNGYNARMHNAGAMQLDKHVAILQRHYLSEHTITARNNKDQVHKLHTIIPGSSFS